MNVSKYQQVQSIAKETIDYLKSYIKAGVTEKDIVEETEKYMLERGVESFWYHNVGAFVFVGERTTISISGRNYIPSDEKVKRKDIVTVDLSPQINNCWGDFARTFIISKGVVIGVDKNDFIEMNKINNELYEGILIEERLHNIFIQNVNKKMTLEEIYILLNSFIEDFGYENLDFANNLGHSIEIEQDKRVYIEEGNHKKLKDINLITFEPHIRKNGGKVGFKREDIYYFSDERLKRL